MPNPDTSDNTATESGIGSPNGQNANNASADNPNTPPAEPSATSTPANAFAGPDFDASEITRKLDGIIETQSILTKAVAELISKGTSSSNAGEATASTRNNGASDSDPYTKPLDVINNLKL
jgi:hypothetical protein